MESRDRVREQVGSKTRMLLAGQAPGSKADQSGVPFGDPSGDRLGFGWTWIQDVFYDPSHRRDAADEVPLSGRAAGRLASADRVCGDMTRSPAEGLG